MDDARLRAALGYLKFKREPRVLIFDTGYLVVGDALDAAEDLGWKNLMSRNRIRRSDFPMKNCLKSTLTRPNTVSA